MESHGKSMKVRELENGQGNCKIYTKSQGNLKIFLKSQGNLKYFLKVSKRSKNNLINALICELFYFLEYFCYISH